MNKMLTLVAGAAMIAGSTMGVANAQGKASGPFADVPTDHWAYQSVEKLRDAGIVIGYPDGTYGGRRAMTRYEFATAIARLLALIPNSAPAAAAPVDMSPYALKSSVPSVAGLAKQADLDALRAEVTRRLQANETAIAALRDLVNQFAPELKKLGADVAAANARIDALDKRLTIVEEEQRRVVITGDVNLIARSDINTKTSGAAPIDKDGNRVGNGSKSLFTSPNVYHDILLNIAGRVSDSAQAVVRIDAGNYLTWLGSATEQNRSTALSGVDATPAATTFNIYEAYLATPVQLGPFGGASATLGRAGVQFTSFTLKAVDPDSYTQLPETDSGNVIVDGGKLEIGGGNSHVVAFAGKAAPIQNFSFTANPNTSRDGGHLPGFNGLGGSTFNANPVDNIAGARATIGNPDSWTAGVTGVLARTTGTAIDPNKGLPITSASVYAADFNGDLPFFGGHTVSLNAEGAINPTGNGSKFANVNSDKGNEAWKAILSFHLGGLALKGGYREVYSNFNAPGSWGKLGSWQNPTNIKGPEVSGTFGFSPNLSLETEAQFYKGINNVGTLNPLGKDDKINRANIGVKYGLSSSQTFDIGYEWVQWDLKNKQGILAFAGKPTEQYITIGYGQSLNKNTAVKLLYQITDYSDKGTGFGGGDAKGGVLVGQASVKF